MLCSLPPPECPVPLQAWHTPEPLQTLHLALPFFPVPAQDRHFPLERGIAVLLIDSSPSSGRPHTQSPSHASSHRGATLTKTLLTAHRKPNIHDRWVCSTSQGPSLVSSHIVDRAYPAMASPTGTALDLLAGEPAFQGLSALAPDWTKPMGSKPLRCQPLRCQFCFSLKKELTPIVLTPIVFSR